MLGGGSLNLSCIQAARKRLRRASGLLRWLFVSANPLASTDPDKRQRLLIIYDYSSQPFSVGDVLIFQQASLILRENFNLGKVDFALVYDPVTPVVPDPAFSYIDSGSFLFHLSTFLPAAQVNPHLGSLLLFDSHSQLESYIADNVSAYHVWPGVVQYASREYLYYHCFNELFPDYFRKHGTLPRLKSRPAAVQWAAAFYERYANSAITVTVQLRKNPVNPARNSDYGSWLEFLEHCVNVYAAKFIIICGHSEVDARFRELPNVVIAKDFGTTVEQDLALIEGAQIHMGASSGPGTIAQFNPKPYCIFNSVMPENFVEGFKLDGNRGRFAFSSPLQSWLTDHETAELLLAEFDRMWKAVHPAVANAIQDKTSSGR